MDTGIDAGAGLQTVRHQRERIAIVPNPPIDDQAISAVARLDSWGSSQPGLRFGLVARYVDSAELLLPLGPQFQFAADPQGGEWSGYGAQPVTLTIQPGDDHSYALEVRGSELSATVDGVVLARAIDEFAHQRSVGLATYRAGRELHRWCRADQP